MLKCLDKVPATSKYSKLWYRRWQSSECFMAGPESPCHIKSQKCCYSMWDKYVVPRFTWRHCRWYIIIEIAQAFQSKHNSVNIVIFGILHHDASWSINWVLIKEINKIFKAKCSKSFFTYISYDRSLLFG